MAGHLYLAQWQVVLRKDRGLSRQTEAVIVKVVGIRDKEIRPLGQRTEAGYGKSSGWDRRLDFTSHGRN